MFINENKDFTHKYKDQCVKAHIKNDFYDMFRTLVKFHKRGIRYIDELEDFMVEIQADPIEYDDKLDYIIFRTHKGQENEVIKKLEQSKYVDFAFQQDDREEEGEKLIEIGNEIVEFGEEYMELSDNEIKDQINYYVESLIKIRNSI